MIDDHWWWGRIAGRRLTKGSSEFLKYRIVWDNGETEFMSPWDMEIAEQTGKQLISLDTQHVCYVLHIPCT